MIEIAANVISAASALVLAGVAVKAFRSFESRKWWERKRDAYLEVLDALADDAAYYDREIGAANQLSEVPKDEIKDLADKSGEARRKIRKAIDLAELFISDEAHQRLLQFRNDTAVAGQFVVDDVVDNDWVKYLFDSQDAIAACRADMIEIMKKDLKLP